MLNFKKYILYEDDTIENCIKKLNDNLNKNLPKIIIIVDKKFIVKGTVTDGDIRRGLIKKIKLNNKVVKIMNKKPLLISNKSTNNDFTKYENFDFPIPVVDSKRKFIELFLNNLNFSQNKISNTILLMAGGFGRRLKPFTNLIPKPMIKIGDKPILEIIINNFKKFGFSNFIISVHYKADIIKKYFKNGNKLGVSIDYIYEKKPLGTAGVLNKIIKKKIIYPIILMNSDVLTNVDFNSLIKYHKENKNDLTICTKKYSINIPYGVIHELKNKVTQIIEKPTQEFDINAGIYVISKKSLDYLKKNNFINMDNFIQQLLTNHKKISSYPLHEYWLDIGKIDDFKQASIK